MKNKILLVFIIILVFGFNAKSQWTYQFGSDHKWYYNIFFTDQDTGYTANWSGEIYKTVNGGINWTLKHSESFGSWGVNFQSPDTGFFVGSQGKVISTYDGGATWNSINVGGANDLFSIDCPAKDTCFIAGNGIILKTTDAGNNWQTIYTSTDWYLGIDFISSQIGYAIGNKIFKTTDGGITWNIVNNSGGREISCATQDVCYAITSGNSVISKTTDGGISWIDFSLGNNLWIDDIQVLNENTIFAACTSQVDLQVVYSIDAGITWFLQQQINDSAGLNSIHMLTENEGWVSGLRGIYHTTNGGGIGLMLTVNPPKIITPDISVFPIPSANLITINWDINGKYDIVILDITGNIIYEEKSKIKSASINISNFSKGVYFVKAIGDDYTQTKKIIIQ
jgi:photosystem II stability/assembly factor-like uncharacterized protein